MRILLRFVCVIALSIVIYIEMFAIDSRLEGTWELTVYNLSKVRIATLVIEFTNDDTEELCSVVGDWKKIEVISYSPTKNSFFPDVDLGILYQELSYRIESENLSIGMNSICDYGKYLKGSLNDSEVVGSYDEWGWEQRKSLGTFKIKRLGT
ncbi:hypothetical protein ACFSJ3_08115 [Corallincola platygyrae]|uniref:Uncharacterized protein n=1 Tax=Corallincola platygyrae TaxID=1193278 RepID=A0ABW4XPJ9_9GAMM